MHGQVRVTLIENDFNKIVELVNNVKLNDADDKRGYKKFFDKIMTYSYVKEDKVIMNLYPSEARLLINLLNKNVNPVFISSNWKDDLVKRKEEYKKSKEGDLND